MGLYRKKGVQKLIPWSCDSDTTNVSISAPDLANGSPRKGDMIAINANNPEDKWLVAKTFFEENYEEVGRQDGLGYDYIGDFNPSGSTSVDQIKKGAASFIDLIDEVCPDGRRKSAALTQIETAAMFSVKSLFV